MDNCEEDLISSDRKLRHNRDRVEVLKMEEEKLSNLVEAEKDQMDQLKGVLEMVEKLEAAHEAKSLDLDTARIAFKKMSSEFRNEYRMYELPHIATTIVSPLLRSHLSDWRPLEEPDRHSDLFLEWRDILDIGDTNVSDAPDPFYNLVWESWMPSVRSSMSQWNTRAPDSLIDFLKTWNEVIPAQITRNIRDLIVLPKLQTDVEQWNPLTDPVPIHSWLHPWLEIIGSQLEIVYPTIRYKLASALQAWHPSDKSARLILLPWKDVFDQASLQAFLLKNICPKLETSMIKFVINPTAQNMDEWSWVTDWQDFLSSATMVALMEKAFFPKWLQVLSSWLNHNPNYTEVTAWYQSWKKEFAAVGDLLAHQQIRAFLHQALEMMNRAVSGGTPMALQPGAMESVRYLSSRESSGSPNPTPPPPPPPPPMHHQPPPPPPPPSETMSFKNLVSKRCAERNIWFTPIPNRSVDGNQVYKCGNVNIYLYENVVFAYRNGRWGPMDLGTLLDEAI
jgi:tuftelin-interacting protein 11